jgi:hypothetical protein
VCQETLGVLLGPSSSPENVVRAARAHAAVCPSCSAALDDPGAAGRVLATVLPSEPVGQGAHGSLLRALLGGLSGVQLAVAAPWLFGHNVAGFLGRAAGEHLTRDGALGLVAAAVGLTVATRPRTALGLRYVVLAVVVMQLVAGAVDEHDALVALHFEAAHALVAAIAVLVVAVSLPARLRLAPRRPPPARLHRT